MAIYEYNSSTINEYSENSFGSILESPNEVFDCGKITNTIEESENYFLISCKSTLLPFGSIKVSKQKTQSKYKVISSFFIRLDKINKKSIILDGLILNWIGYGTVFEFDNGLERQVIPDVSGGGILK